MRMRYPAIPRGREGVESRHEILHPGPVDRVWSPAPQLGAFEDVVLPYFGRRIG
jgi:hypothetical protein